MRRNVDSPYCLSFPSLRAESLGKIALGRLGEDEQDVGPMTAALEAGI